VIVEAFAAPVAIATGAWARTFRIVSFVVVVLAVSVSFVAHSTKALVDAAAVLVAVERVGQIQELCVVHRHRAVWGNLSVASNFNHVREVHCAQLRGLLLRKTEKEKKRTYKKFTFIKSLSTEMAGARFRKHREGSAINTDTALTDTREFLYEHGAVKHLYHWSRTYLEYKRNQKYFQLIDVIDQFKS
jgi:hypothetical protein